MLSKPAEDPKAFMGDASEQLASPWGQPESWESRTPLRWRLSLVTGWAVAIAVTVATIATYWSVSTLMTASVDQDMDLQATRLLAIAVDEEYEGHLPDIIESYKSFNPDVRVAATPTGWSFAHGDSIPMGGEFVRTTANVETSVRTLGEERVLAKRHADGATVVLAREMKSTQALISTLGAVLAVLGALGIVLAILAGMWVSKSGLRPITRLQKAADYVTQTNDLRPIRVVGTDEIAQLTISFNQMLAALQESRIRQSQFVADAGHELKTPLTSMRTNIELLMMVTKPGGGSMSEKDRKELEDDVLAQMAELSSLIGDLVDLAREDASERATEDVELHEVIDISLGRAKRRRPDVDFKVRVVPWILQGDSFALGRAILNLLDNAAKWSPPSGTVRVVMEQVGENQLRLRVDDSGPGIPLADRERVFERFFRSPEARSMPGSGLGLAIVRQVIERHTGTISVSDSPDGGTRMEVLLPGRRGEGEIFQDSGMDVEDAGSERREIFAQRWFNRQ